tara:strand:- start:1080 stop:1214 length:135 start_codon:yes stop_codon:yes gene_type:complete
MQALGKAAAMIIRDVKKTLFSLSIKSLPPQIKMCSAVWCWCDSR